MALTIIDGFAWTEVIKTSWAGVHDTTGIDYLHTQAALAFLQRFSLRYFLHTTYISMRPTYHRGRA